MHSIINIVFIYVACSVLLTNGVEGQRGGGYYGDRSNRRRPGFGRCEHWKNFPKESTPKVPYLPFECPDPDNDAVGQHLFQVARHEDPDMVYGNHFAVLNSNVHWYHAVATFKFLKSECRVKVMSALRPSPQHLFTLFHPTEGNKKLFDLLSPGNKLTLGLGFSLQSNLSLTQPIAFCKMEVKEVIELRRFPRENLAAVPFPGDARYLLYGDRKHKYISHIPTKCTDYTQIIRVSNLPLRFRKKKRTAVIRLPNVPGRPRSPLSENKLTEQRYKFYTEDKPFRLHRFSIQKLQMFDTRVINVECPASGP